MSTLAAAACATDRVEVEIAAIARITRCPGRSVSASTRVGSWARIAGRRGIGRDPGIGRLPAGPVVGLARCRRCFQPIAGDDVGSLHPSQRAVEAGRARAAGVAGAKEIDDWLRDPLTRLQAQDLLEILDDRYSRSSTLVATQVPVAEWHARLPDPTIADAILDRLVHNAYRLALKGESRRRTDSPLPMPTT